jgi:hypothetical protein
VEFIEYGIKFPEKGRTISAGKKKVDNPILP